MNTKTRFQWVEKNETHWLGIIEITGAFGMETFRVKIETQFVDTYKFFHYKFQRFNFDNRTWTMDAIKINYPVDFFRELEARYFEHLNTINPENILITYKKAIDVTRNRRMRIYRFFCKKLEQIGYVFIEHEEPTFSALLCFKNDELITLNKNNTLNNYLNTSLSRFEFYY